MSSRMYSRTNHASAVSSVGRRGGERRCALALSLRSHSLFAGHAVAVPKPRALYTF